MIEITIVKERHLRVAHGFICIFSRTYTVRYQPAVQTRGHARAYLTPSSLLPISLSPSPFPLSLHLLARSRSLHLAIVEAPLTPVHCLLALGFMAMYTPVARIFVDFDVSRTLGKF